MEILAVDYVSFKVGIRSANLPKECVSLRDVTGGRVAKMIWQRGMCKANLLAVAIYLYNTWSILLISY